MSEELLEIHERTQRMLRESRAPPRADPAPPRPTITRTFLRLGWPFVPAIHFSTDRATLVHRAEHRPGTGRKHAEAETLYKTSTRWFLVEEHHGRTRVIWIWQWDARLWLQCQANVPWSVIAKFCGARVIPA